ncbi:hypothetical protein HPP92_005967 [Vanilla planifolia]|uniref:Uncharacterized protein n=1 Tax=Vanilla planifolia TaxID=51239 RepID=A0A835RZU5_VANPL|nr:hypothetical protein HPP92_005967 [Vanilla planifolia]
MRERTIVSLGKQQAANLWRKKQRRIEELPARPPPASSQLPSPLSPLSPPRDETITDRFRPKRYSDDPSFMTKSNIPIR